MKGGDAGRPAALLRPERIGRALGRRERRRIPEGACDLRAAVALVLRPAAGPAEALFVRRAELDGDPWSGHVALPGGRRSPDDPDLLATALRETREETALALRPEDVLGALDDLRPVSPHLPSIAITPFVAWYEGEGDVRGNREIVDHRWIPLEALRDPARRDRVEVAREGRILRFPAVRAGDYRIWGLTLRIAEDFLRVLEEVAPGGEE